MTYENPPIQEAVFDIQVDRLSIESVDQLRSFRTKLHNDFHSDEGKPLFNVTVQIGAEGKQSQTEPKTTGYLFKTKGKQVQVRENSLTLNVLRPYSNWENHFSEFEGYWELFKELFQPVTVQRIATRFINRIEIPIPFKNFEDYISNMPPIPKILPQNFSSFFMQIQVPVVLGNHLDVGMPEQLGNGGDIGPIHERPRRVAVPVGVGHGSRR